MFVCLSSKLSLCWSCTYSKAICCIKAVSALLCPFPGKAEEGPEESSEEWLAGGGTALPLRPELRPCLTGPPLPGWSLPLLGQQYLDTLTSWYCSFQDCCGGGDCRITNNFTG